MCACACVCVCACLCVHACVRACVHAWRGHICCLSTKLVWRHLDVISISGLICQYECLPTFIKFTSSKEINFLFSCVHATLYITLLVSWSVGPLVSPSHIYSAGNFCITAPTQSRTTDAVMYLVPPLPLPPKLLPLPNRTRLVSCLRDGLKSAGVSYF